MISIIATFVVTFISLIFGGPSAAATVFVVCVAIDVAMLGGISAIRLYVTVVTAAIITVPVCIWTFIANPILGKLASMYHWVRAQYVAVLRITNRSSSFDQEIR